MVVEKKDLDWSSLGFSYIKTDYRFRARWREGVWQPGELVESEVMEVHEGSPVLHYAQACFEGLKAQSSPDDKILLFRPELNCQRMAQTADRSVMPEVPEALFMQGITEWMEGWKAKNWKTAAKKPVKNQDLWQEIDKAIQNHDIELVWVKGHAGNDGNEKADELARQGIPV